MTDRPILFSGPMVRALLDGRKTQTRRLVDNVPPQPDINCHPQKRQLFASPYLDSYCSERKTSINPRGMSVEWCWWQVDDRQCLPVFKVKAKPGDRLWVREAFRGSKGYDNHPPKTWSHWPVHYEADGSPDPRDEMEENGKLRPGIHMPRWASRLTLSVKDVRIERLQDISEADARAEGCPVSWDGKPYAPPPPEVDGWQGYGRASFCLLWSKINGPGSWEANPWVAAYTFTVAKGNIDQIARAA